MKKAKTRPLWEKNSGRHICFLSQSQVSLHPCWPQALKPYPLPQLEEPNASWDYLLEMRNPTRQSSDHDHHMRPKHDFRFCSWASYSTYLGAIQNCTGVHSRAEVVDNKASKSFRERHSRGITGGPHLFGLPFSRALTNRCVIEKLSLAA